MDSSQPTPAPDDLMAIDDAVVEPRVPDTQLAAAVDLAREAALSEGGDTVGEHFGVEAEGPLVATHGFRSSLPGYSGWYWAVTVTRTAGLDDVTVDEVVLLPGAGALLAPEWVPWNERVRPGDLGPGDLMPPAPGDPRLVPAYAEIEDPEADDVAFELGLGREQVMSREGRLDAAERWLAGDSGPDAPMARQAPARCGTCAFLLGLSGSLRAAFGVCGNEITTTDGRVVSVEFGCGAHSDTRADGPSPAEPLGVVYDDGDEIEVHAPRPQAFDEVAPDPAGVPADADHADVPAGV